MYADKLRNIIEQNTIFIIDKMLIISDDVLLLKYRCYI